jgi:hypothetical protein
MRDPDTGWVIFLTWKTSSWNNKKHEKIRDENFSDPDPGSEMKKL